MDDDRDQLRRIRDQLDQVLAMQAGGLLGEIQAGLDRLDAAFDRLDRQAALMGAKLTAQLRATNRSLAAQVEELALAPDEKARFLAQLQAIEKRLDRLEDEPPDGAGSSSPG